MSKFKPLLEEEVPGQYRWRIEFDRQEVCNVLYPGRTKQYLRIPVRCKICQRQNLLPVNDVRNWVRGQRRGPFPGDHRGCKYPGRYHTKEGYVWIWTPEHPKAYDGKYVPEHILVMEEKLGRYLDREVESVHHIDGNKVNNHLDNLQLRNRYHGKGQAWQCLDCGSDNVKAVNLAEVSSK